MSYKESQFNVWQYHNDKRYLINTFTKSVALIDDETYAKISPTLALNDLPKNTLDSLIKNGFVIDESTDELKLLHYKYKQSYYSSQYLFITLIMTMKCNFHCPYCFEAQKQQRMTNASIDSLKAFSRNMFRQKSLIHISLFGGEPLLEFDKISTYLDYVNNLQKEYKFRYDSGITTNGYLLSNDVINQLVDQYNAVTFQVTIDGCEKTHNQTRALHSNKPTYSEVLINFKKLIEKNRQINGKIDPTLRVNLLNNSLEDVENLLNEFSDNEKLYFRLYFRPIYNTPNFCTPNKNKQGLELFYNLAREKHFRASTTSSIKFHHCEGDSGLNVIQVMPDLSVWKCINDIDFSGAHIGEISAGGDFKINYQNLENWSQNDPFMDDKCRNCKVLPLCWGGCPLNFLKADKRNCIYEKNFDIRKIFLNNE